MNISDAHRQFVDGQHYEWQRWARAYVQLKRAINQFVDGVIDQTMMYAQMDALEMVLASMIEVRPETLTVILDVMEQVSAEGQHSETPGGAGPVAP